MSIETHTPAWQDPNEVAAFVRHTSRPSGPADQTPTSVTLPHTHPDLGQVVTITINAAKDGNKSNTIILHLPIKTLAQWVMLSLPDTPKVGTDISDIDLSFDFSDLDLDTGE